MSFTDQPLIGDPEPLVSAQDLLATEDSVYQGPDVELDEQAIAQQVFDDLATRAPGWAASDGNLDTWLIEAFASVAASVRALAADVPAAIFRTYGTQILGITIDPPLPAQGSAHIEVVDAQGYTIQAGTQLALYRTGDEQIGFETVSDLTIAPGAFAGDVGIQSLVDGTLGNGLTGQADVLDPIAWISLITVADPTYGGDDGQTDSDYLDNLSVLLKLVAIRPILPGDFATLALQDPNVGRAIAMDGYNPADDTWGNERMVTLILTDMQGQPLPQAVKDAIAAQLEGLREVNFIVNIMDADYQAVDVHVDAQGFPQMMNASVEAAIVEEVTGTLSPTVWRLGTLSADMEAGEVIPSPDQTPDPDGPAGRQVIRVNEIVAIADRSRGVDWVTAVTIDGTAADLTLGNAWTLPQPGAITATVVGGIPAPATP